MVAIERGWGVENSNGRRGGKEADERDVDMYDDGVDDVSPGNVQDLSNSSSAIGLSKLLNDEENKTEN